MIRAKPRWETVAVGGVKWRVVPELASVLFDADGLRLPEWLRGGAATVVKAGPHRTVYRVSLPGLSFYLKHYPLHDLRAWLRSCVRPTKGRAEFERGLAVAAAGIPTAVPLAFGESTGLGPQDSFLITRSLDRTEPLNHFLETSFPLLPPGRQSSLRRLLAEQLARLVGRMHDAGIVHTDLHPGNLLVRTETDRPELFLIDLHTVRQGGPLGWEASLRNLVILNHWFSMRAGRTDRLRFWLSYAAARERGVRLAGSERLHLAREVERQTWQSNLRFWLHRDRRCLVNNRYYRRVARGNVQGFAVRDLDESALAAFLADPDGPLDAGEARTLKDGRSSTVVELELPGAGGPRRMIYKRFRIADALEPYKSLARPSPALRSWVFGQGLRERCLPTARPLLLLRRRRRGLEHEGYLLTEKICDACELRDYVERLNALPEPERILVFRRTLDVVARLVRDLHARRLSHRDLKATNLLVQPERPSIEQEERCWLIDLVGVCRHRRLPRRLRVRDLARIRASFLTLSRTECLRFLRTYLQFGLFGRHRWKRWWKEIAAATQRKVERNRRSGRPLA